MIPSVLVRRLLFIAGCAFCASALAQDAPNALAAGPGFIPSIVFAEQLADSIKVTPPSGPDVPPFSTYEPVTKTTTSISLTANITGINLADIEPSSLFEFSFGGVFYSGTLGEDPGYTEATKASKRNVFIAANSDPGTGEPAKSGNGVKLSWTSTRLTIKVLCSSEDTRPTGSVAVADLAGTSNRSLRVVRGVGFRFTDQVAGSRLVFISGASSVTPKVVGSVKEGNLFTHNFNKVGVTGAFDLVAPTLILSGPRSPVVFSAPGGMTGIFGKASDAADLQSISYATGLSPSSPDWTEVAMDPQSPALPPGHEWGPESAGYAFGMENIPAGTFHVFVRATDSSGNQSRLSSVSIHVPINPALAGRWDAIVVPENLEGAKPGYITFTSGKSGVTTGSVRLEGMAAPLPFTGIASDFGIYAEAKRPNLPPIIIQGVVVPETPASAATARMICLLSDDSLGFMSSGTAQAFRSPWSASNKIPAGSPAVGRFHFSHIEAPSAPTGHGYFAATVTSTGGVTLAGKLADGTLVSASTFLGANGQIPAYFPLYSGKGSFSTAQQLDMASGAVLGGAVACRWNRPPMVPGSQFPIGFKLLLNTLGARYVPPAADVRVLGLSGNGATAQYSGQGVAPEMTISLAVTTANKFTPADTAAGFSAAVVPPTGLFTGSFNLPGTKVKAAFNAIALGNKAYGHYIAPAAAGYTAKHHGRLAIMKVE